MSLTISIRNFIKYILIIVSAGGLIISGLGLSNSLYYLADALNIILFLYAIQQANINDRSNYLLPLKILLTGFILVTIIGGIGNFVSLLLFLWGVRNVYRYIIFFISCIILLDSDDIEKFLDIIPMFFWVDLLLTMVQFFVFDLRGDYLGGIFGISQGCNGMTIIFINICLAFIVAQYLGKSRSLVRTIPYIIGYFIITALSETKGNFFFFVIIVILLLAFGKKSFKSVLTGIFAVVAVYVGIWILSIYFPKSVSYLLDSEAMLNYLDASYLGTTTFTRNSIIQVTNTYFFKDNTWLRLFGYGLGACDTSSFFTSPFYASYGYMNYRQYSSAMTLLQTGYLGFVIYILFFLYIAFISFRSTRGVGNMSWKNEVYLAVSVLAIFAIVDSFYASLYIDMGYWIFFVLSFPFVLLKEEYLSCENDDALLSMYEEF